MSKSVTYWPDPKLPDSLSHWNFPKQINTDEAVKTSVRRPLPIRGSLEDWLRGDLVRSGGPLTPHARPPTPAHLPDRRRGPR